MEKTGMINFPAIQVNKEDYTLFGITSHAWQETEYQAFTSSRKLPVLESFCQRDLLAAQCPPLDWLCRFAGVWSMRSVRSLLSADNCVFRAYNFFLSADDWCVRLLFSADIFVDSMRTVFVVSWKFSVFHAYDYCYRLIITLTPQLRLAGHGRWGRDPVKFSAVVCSIVFCSALIGANLGTLKPPLKHLFTTFWPLLRSVTVGGRGRGCTCLWPVVILFQMLTVTSSTAYRAITEHSCFAQWEYDVLYFCLFVVL